MHSSRTAPSARSLGATYGDIIDVMVEYGAVNACNLDGGSSSIMVYNGRVISRPSAANKTDGRHIPNGIAVYRRETASFANEAPRED